MYVLQSLKFAWHIISVIFLYIYCYQASPYGYNFCVDTLEKAIDQ